MQKTQKPSISCIKCPVKLGKARTNALLCHLQWSRRRPRHHSWAECWAQDQRRNSSYCTMPSPLMSTLLSEKMPRRERHKKDADSGGVLCHWNCVLQEHGHDTQWSGFCSLNLTRQWGSTSLMMIHAVLWPYEVCKLLIICCWTCLANWRSITPLWQVWMYHGGI